MRSIAAGMSPAKIAMAVAVTMAPRAGTGSMKNVTGTRSAVAIVAVSPGMAPTNIPNAADAAMTHSTLNWKTRPKAKTIASMVAPPLQNVVEPAARQGHAHGGSEEPVDGPGRHDRGRDGNEPAHPEPQEENGKDDDRDRD